MTEPVLSSSLPPSDSWKCYRCKTVILSPGDGRSPSTCLESLGGCGRSREDDENYTRFFPADWSEAKVQLHIDADLNEGQRLFRDVAETLRAHYYMEAPWHYVIATLFVLQAWVAPALPVVFYLPVAGTKGTGKTNFLSLLASLTDALQFENVSVAAMARTMRVGRTVTMDEYDVDRGKEANEVRDSLLRSGYKRNAAPYVRWDAARRCREEISVFGPRAFGYRGTLDDALQDRGFPIPSVKPVGEPGYKFVLKNFWPEIGDLVASLKAWGEHARLVFTPERLKKIAYLDAFRRKVKGAVQELGANRDSELVTIALLVAEMAGVDVIEALKEAGKLREIESFGSSDLDMDDLRESILDEAGPIQQGILENAPTVRMKQVSVRRRFDERRKARGARHISDGGFAKLRRELLKEEWLGSHNHAIYWSLPIPFITGLQAPQAPEAPPNPYGERGSQGRQGKLMGPEAETPIAKSQPGPGEAPGIIWSILRGLGVRGARIADDDALRLAEGRGIPREKTASIIARLLEEGEAYRPQTGFLRLTEGL